MQAEAKKIDYKIASDLSNVVMAAFSHQKGGVTKAVDSALQGMMSNMIQNVFKNILSASGIGQALAGNLIGKLVFGTGQAAEQATANATAMTPVLAAFLTPITALLTTMNGLLGGLVAKPSFLGNTFSLSGIVPSAADGWALPSFSGGQLSMLHANEMVLPANISQGLQGMIASGGTGGGHNITINAVDANSVAKLFCNNGGALVAALNSAMRNGSALRTSSFSNGG